MFDPEEAGPVNLQFIDNDGQKWFIAGGRARGCFYVITGVSDQVVVCEGYSFTAASIHEATGYAVGVAFSAGNLVEVASMIRRELNDGETYLWRAHREAAAGRKLRHERRQTFLNVKLIIAADDDSEDEEQSGLDGGDRRSTGHSRPGGGSLLRRGAAGGRRPT